MPSGKNHDRITWLCLPWIILLTMLFTRETGLILLTAFGFVFSGLMFGPDLDIYSIQYQRWGWLKFIWLPYQKSLKHRSILSHGILIGTILRILYLLFIVWLIGIFCVAIAQLIGGFTWNWQHFCFRIYQEIKTNYLAEIVTLAIALELGAMSHYLADSLSRWRKYGAKTQLLPLKKANKTQKSRKKNIR
jgi:uncharacterized metal-binding protein